MMIFIVGLKGGVGGCTPPTPPWIRHCIIDGTNLGVGGVNFNLYDVIYERPLIKIGAIKVVKGLTLGFPPSIGFLRYIRIVNSDAKFSRVYLCSC